LQRFKLLIQGIVQGIGFRPFIYNLAKKHGLTGYVKNGANGVVVEVQGDMRTIEAFIQEVHDNPLPLCRIDLLTKKSVAIKSDEKDFIIVKSDASTQKTTLVSPDIKICSECADDLQNPNSRYYGYFALNCTNCGPRYSIIQTLPYDRANTSMQPFVMCTACQSEYEDIANRRFHAQPVSCADCGPKLDLYKKAVLQSCDDPIYEIAKRIKHGAIVAIKGIGGFHIVCDAKNDEALQKLRRYKNRPRKPFALMCKNIAQAKTVAHISTKEQEVLESLQAPIVILRKKEDTISPDVAPQIDKIGIMLPYTGLHLLLFGYLENPIVATSANLGDEPIIKSKEQVVEKLGFIEYILDFNREIVNCVDDSLVQVVDEKVQVLRAARGYTPLSIKLPKAVGKKLLAVGANQKNTVAIAFEDNLVLSPHIGDLDSVANMEYFHNAIESLQRFYDFSPSAIVCDKHPNYASTLWAKEQQLPVQTIQHHKAHLNAVKAEYGLSGDAFTAFIFDGTGYGEDATVWGGEVFVAGKRKYYFKPLKLLGGEKAVKEPKRVALAMVFEHLSLQETLGANFDFLKEFSPQEIKLLRYAYEKGINSPYSSSVGRLFDGVAALCGLLQTMSYEGQSGLLCEKAYQNSDATFTYSIDDGVIDIHIVPYLLSPEANKTLMPTMLINTLAHVSLEIAKKEGLPVLMSGGVFQNATLANLFCKKLKESSIPYYFNALIPPNDGGISVGQIYSTLS
jgi:hydrogenase maturation protein HypF